MRVTDEAAFGTKGFPAFNEHVTSAERIALRRNQLEMILTKSHLLKGNPGEES